MVALAIPIIVVASHRFADVPDSNLFRADIAAIADAGVTSGCGGDNYCPSSAVTREQLAAFINRLGPVLKLEGWQISVSNWGSASDTLQAVALCADAAPLHVPG